jgi:Tol biopolymer transport system component
MLRHRSILVTIVTSLLLASSSFAAPGRAAPQLSMYLPHIHASQPCASNPIAFAPLLAPRHRIAFWEADDLWLFDPASDQVERLVQNAGSAAFAWSPDGTRIAFTSRDLLASPSAINIVRLADHHVTTVIRLPDGQSPGNLTWSPDGQRIAFDLTISEGLNESSHIMLMQANGTQLQQLTAMGNAMAPAWSPDGRHIAFVSLDASNRQGMLYLVQPDGRNLRPITQGLNLFSRLAWSPDSLRIAFNGECLEGQMPGGYGLFIITIDGSIRTPLAYVAGAGPDSLGSWSPDTQQIVYEQTHGHGSNIVLLTSDGSGYNILSITGSHPTWAPR